MMERRELYKKIALKLQAIRNCKAAGNTEWESRQEEALEDLLAELPSGSGVDNGTTLLRDRSTPEKLVFQADYHHMDEGGCYDGWTEHRVIITPSLAYGFDVRVTGRDRNQIKDYLAELFT